MKKLLSILAIVSCLTACAEGRKPSAGKEPAPQPVKEYGIEVVQTYPHDVHAYTQGLFFHDGLLYESTGQYGESTLRRYTDFKKGQTDRVIGYGKNDFMEGSVIFKDKLYLLTWTNAKVLVYDAASLELQETLPYRRQGWGLTTDGQQLIASDGSSKLYFMDGKLNVLRSGVVRKSKTPVAFLNELEYIDGKIWANVYTTDEIVIINPETLQVEASIDCTNLLDKTLRTPDTDVLNGIAYNPSDKKLYLTGKNWPLLFEVKLVAR